MLSCSFSFAFSTLEQTFLACFLCLQKMAASMTTLNAKTFCGKTVELKARTQQTVSVRAPMVVRAQGEEVNSSSGIENGI